MTLWEAEELRGATVLVTGADGFIGSHLVDASLEAGAHGHAFVRATSSGTLNNIEHVRKRIMINEGDVADMHSVLDEGLRRTVEWYREQRADADACPQPVLPS